MEIRSAARAGRNFKTSILFLKWWFKKGSGGLFDDGLGENPQTHKCVE
jgi:hypothetical protein